MDLEQKRNELLEQADAIVEAAEKETRGLTEDEEQKHRELVAEAAKLRGLMEARAARDAEAAQKLPELQRALDVATGGDEDGGEGGKPAEKRGGHRIEETLRDPVYHARGDQSYFLDVAKAEMRGDSAARERLVRADAFTRQEMLKRDLNNASDAAGGAAVVPLYLQDRFEKARLAKAITSQLTSQEAMPEKGDTITIPIQNGSAAVAALAQASPLNSLQETDATFTTATESVVEVGGVQDISNFINDRGALGASVDSIIADHLASLLAVDEDARVLAKVRSGAGVAVTYTATTGTLVGIYTKIADAIQQVHTGNLEAPTGIVVHPRRFAKWASELDSNNRPLMVPMSVAQNPLAWASGDGTPVAQGFTGYSIHGLPIYVDANVLTTSDTNQDTAYVCDWKKQYTWLGNVMVDIDRSVMFKQSGLTIRARRYFATMVGHRDDAFATITGTGLATPSF